MNAEIATPNDLMGWKRWFRDHIEEARCAVMSDNDREELIRYLQEQADAIFYGPAPDLTADDCTLSGDAWAEIGYR